MRRAGRSPRILVAGLGNLLLGDDGAGVHAVRAVCGKRWPGVMAAEIGTAVLDALHLFERANYVLAIDAMCAGGKPGDIYRIAIGDTLDPPAKASLHDFGLRSACELMRGPRPEIVVFGVEPEKIGYGLELSPAVAAALPRLIAEVRRTVDELRTRPELPGQKRLPAG